MSNARIEANRGQGTKGGQFGFARDQASTAVADDRADMLDDDDDEPRLPDGWDDDVLDESYDHYLAAAAWSSSDTTEDGEDVNLDDYEFSDDARAQLRDDFDDFVKANAGLIERQKEADPMMGSPEQVGHDFWLTRNGHGAGFWDRGTGQVGKELTDAAKVYSTVDLYLNEDTEQIEVM